MSDIKLAFVGDVMLGDIFWTMGSGVASNISKYGLDFLDENIREIFNHHHMAFCNVESILSNVGKRKYSLRKMDMRGNPSSAELLAQWGFTVANVANNHILEHGMEAAKDTVKQLEKAEITVVGAGKDSAFRNGIESKSIVVKGTEFVFLALCLRDEKYAYDGGIRVEDAINETHRLSSQGKNVIVSIHWGSEYIDRPAKDQKELADTLTAKGAMMVIGHHPHVPHGVQLKNNQLVAYSLGNFIFGEFYNDTDWSMILSVTVSGNKVTDFELIPFKKDFRHSPVLLHGAEKEKYQAELERRNKLVARDIQQWDSADSYDKEVHHLTEGFRSGLKKELLKNAKYMNPVYWPQVLMRPIQRRLGLW